MTARFKKFGLYADHLGLFAHHLQEGRGIDLFFAAFSADRIQRRAEEVHIGDAGNLDRILKCQEDAGGGALLRLHLQRDLRPHTETEPPVTS